MSAAAESIHAPFTAFAFDIVLTLAEPLPGVGDPVCEGAFSECDGISLEMEARAVDEGGANDSVTHLVGATRPGQITLRRGMTTTTDLWAWMAAAGVPGRAITADGQITMYDAARDVQARILVGGCLPVRLRGPSLHATTGIVAIEELGLAVGHLALEGAGGGGIGASIGGSIGASFTANVQVSGGLGLSGRLGGTASASASAGVRGGIG